MESSSICSSFPRARTAEFAKPVAAPLLTPHEAMLRQIASSSTQVQLRKTEVLIEPQRSARGSRSASKSFSSASPKDAVLREISSGAVALRKSGACAGDSTCAG